MRNLKQALNHRIFWGEVHRVIKFNENAWLKPCIDMNTDLRKKVKNYSEKDFFKLMNNAVYETTENVIKERDMRYKTFHNIKQKKQIVVRTKLSYYKTFHRKYVGCRNEKNADFYQQTSLFSTFNTRIK